MLPTTRGRAARGGRTAKGGAKWAETARSMLLEVEMGDDWKEVVRLWWTLEEQWKFASSTKSHDDHRPKAVGVWVKNARKGNSDIGSASGMEREWWAWWKGINPGWRMRDGELLREGDGGWDVLRCPGQNGFLNIIVPEMVAFLHGDTVRRVDVCRRGREVGTGEDDRRWVVQPSVLQTALTEMFQCIPRKQRTGRTVAGAGLSANEHAVSGPPAGSEEPAAGGGGGDVVVGDNGGPAGTGTPAAGTWKRPRQPAPERPPAPPRPPGSLNPCQRRRRGCKQDLMMYGVWRGARASQRNRPAAPRAAARSRAGGTAFFLRPPHLDWEKPLFGMPGDERQSSNDGLMGLEALPKPALRPPEPLPTHARDPGILPDGPTHRVYLIEHRDLGLAPYSGKNCIGFVRLPCIIAAIESMDSGRDSGDAVSISIYVNIFAVGISAS
ncbi:hypothetical protein B0H14DRAFT_2619019 [Mycena olivaceomarginata]|nr:hypothetical protein B0H14DRAFT_2619019 [Mycena olivaceomarginata]